MQTSDLFSQQVAVVTGANRGIGKAIARELGRRGARLGICARGEEALNATAHEFREEGIDVFAASVDVTDENAVEAFFAAIHSRWGRLDILVNNAGAFDGGPLDELTLQAWNNVIGACLTGTFLCTRTAFRLMKRQRRGRILNIGSISAQRPRAASVPYAAAKFGVWGLTQAAALDARPYGITVCCLHPGNVRVERREGTDDPADREPMMEMDTIARAALAMLSMPPDVNWLEAIVLPRDQLYLGRG
ncbi:MAG: SDR family oxidoreductase [Planctomycetota bacterium]|nr:MAG: SDR family oxidoreductase [Planctomycetota bacterium]